MVFKFKKYAPAFVIAVLICGIVGAYLLERQDISPSPPIEKCPDISFVKKVLIQSPLRRDGKQIPSNTPTILNVPYAYLDQTGRKYNNLNMLSIYAIYDTLEPACTQFPANTPFLEDGGQIFNLYLTRHSKAEAFINANSNQVKNQEIWKLEESDTYKNYDHYFAFHSSVPDHILIPKNNELDTEYVVTCRGKNLKESGMCRLLTDYRHEFLVSSAFSIVHLENVRDVYEKTIQLLDRLYDQSNGGASR